MRQFSTVITRALPSALHEAHANVYSIFFMKFEGSFYNMFTFYN